MAVERELLEQFQQRFQTACGREYFNGDIHAMRDCFVNCVMRYTNRPNVKEKILTPSEQVSFESVKDHPNKVVCKKCEKVMMKTNMNRHKTTCKGVPLKTCMYCFKVFGSVFSKHNHTRICKTKTIPVEMNQSTIICFGQTENMDFVLENEKYYEKYLPKLRNHFDVVVDFVFFNKDRTDNHTIRKRVKKSELIEYRYGNQSWDHELPQTLLPRFWDTLEKVASVLKINDVLTQWRKDYDNNILSEMLYHKTNRGLVDETCILERII